MSMISVRVSDSVTRNSLILDDTTTIRSAFDQADIGLNGMIMINGVTIGAGELDTPIKDFGFNGDKVYLTVCAKLDNAYTVTVYDNKALVKSEIKFDDLAIVENYLGHLEICDEESGEPVFKVTTGEPASISEYGIKFKRNSNGAAVVSMEVDGTTEEEIKEDIYANYGTALTHLRTLETKITEEGLVDEARGAKATVFDRIRFIEM